MSKKLVIISLVSFIVLLGLGVFGYFAIYAPSKEIKKSSASALPTESPTGEEKLSGDLLYNDESGFSFRYPKSATITDVTPSDSVYYSMLSAKLPKGDVKIKVMDTNYKTINDWLSKDQDSPKDAKLVGAVSMAGLSASQYSYDSGKKELTLVIDKGIIYLIEGARDGSILEDFQNLIASTFSLQTVSSNSSASGGASDAIYEEEEVVE